MNRLRNKTYPTGEPLLEAYSMKLCLGIIRGRANDWDPSLQEYGEYFVAKAGHICDVEVVDLGARFGFPHIRMWKFFTTKEVYIGIRPETSLSFNKF
jgi:hypothetical protein